MKISPEVSAMKYSAKLRRVLLLVPWRMRGRLLIMTAASIGAALLDMAGVLTMAPLMQLLTTPDGIPPLVSKYVVPIFGTTDRKRLLLVMALTISCLFILKDIALVAIRWWSVGQMSKATAAAQAEMLRRYSFATYGSHRMRSKADIIQVVSGTTGAAISGNFLAIINIITDLTTAVLLLATLLAVSPVSSIMAIVVFGGASLLMVRVIKPHALKAGLKTLSLNTESWAYLNPAVEGFRESRIFGREASFVDRYHANRMATVAPERLQKVLGELPRYLMEVVMIVSVMVIGFFLFGTEPESTAFGILGIFAAAAVRIGPSLNRVVGSVNGLKACQPALDQLLTEMGNLDSAESLPPSEDDSEAPLPEADIVVSDVSFHYPDSQEYVLTDVNVTIPQGSTVALVGSSGAGKSTFADLLLGLLAPTSGYISVAGTNIATHPRRWRHSVAAVSQQVYLWNAPVRDLITFSEPEDRVDHARLDNAIRQAQLETMIAELPNGLDTIVGEAGTRLSGGQAQRVGIARALYTQPSVLVLDEATSALDNETEHEITQTLEQLHGQLTIIAIAHRLSTVKNADEILFFSKGCLAARGTMTSLARENTEFARLVELGKLT